MLVSDVIVVSEPRGLDFRMLLAADRAGARAILDTEWLDSRDARQRIEQLDSAGLSRYGLLVGPGSESWLPQVLANASSKLTWVVVTGGTGSGQKERLAAVRQASFPVWFEAINLGELGWAVKQEVDGLILKGHEAAGRIGEESSFVLCQGAARMRDLGTLRGIPWYVRGGVGLHSAGALLVGGSQGVVLDQQLCCAREAPSSGLSPGVMEVLDGSETNVWAWGHGVGFRHHARSGPRPATVVQERAAEPVPGSMGVEDVADWTLVRDRLAEGILCPMSQDRAWASSLARDYVTTAGILDALVAHANRHVQWAQQIGPFREGSPFAEEHGIRFPIVQGPMTRVSDTASFAESVAVAGGLPFLALALLRGAECDKLLAETKARLGSRAWGVGLLGFVPAELRDEQLAAISRSHPPFALIAGGRPDQAKSLEQAGIPTYLHAPSPGLLRMFLREGARRFIFEGRECGGHVGPRTSLVLWEQMCQVVEEHLQAAPSDTNMSLIFAGGVHDARSCAMVAALIAPLAARGVRCGVLMGTAYLFTHEAITSGAIVPQFQEQAIACQTTTLLQTAPGHAIRCVPTPYCDDFRRERQRMVAEGNSAEEITRNLEWMNLGRLRLASKGLERAGSDAELVPRSDDDQHRHGMYMIGQVAALRDKVTSVVQLHEDVCLEGTRYLSRVLVASACHVDDVPAPCEIAIVGMACFYPGSSSLGEYWNNILRKVDAVTEIPGSHWDWRLYYDPDLRTRDKIISKWGGFLQEIDFDPLQYGITPNSLHSIEPLQLYLLEATRRALVDAGYQRRPFPRERTAAILGIGGGGSPLAVAYGLRTCLPLLNTVPGNIVNGDKQLEICRPYLPEWTEDSFPGILSNVAVGRVANRFDLGGPNYAIDAACGSSLAAVHACVRELQTGTSDFALAMGADTVQTPYAYMAFSKTFALSPRGRCRPFDAEADGIVLSEGIGVVALKRLADALRDGDRIYAVIQGMGASSDGRDKGLTAPRAEGQLRALRRAYAQARISPAELELIEAHGTGTVVGDQTESRTLSQIMEEAGAEPRSCLVGSVKSMIGHSKCAAGIAGLIKTALALKLRVLPPTIVEHPNAKGKFGEGPLSLNTEAIPWVHDPETPRRAGVSAFGFGGTNFHAVLSEHVDMMHDTPASALTDWPAELCVWSSENLAGLRRNVQETIDRVRRIQAGSYERVSLAEIAASLWKSFQPQVGRPTLAVVATSLDDLAEKLTLAGNWMATPRRSADEAGDLASHVVRDPRGVFLTWELPNTRPRTAMLFAGQGSQYLRMGAEMGLAFPRFQQVLDRAAGVLRDVLPQPLARYLYPGSSFSPDEARAQNEAITSTEIAQPALGAIDLGYWYVLTDLGIVGDCLAGHSFGEYVALCASGCLAEAELLNLAFQRGQVIRDVARSSPGGMTALDGDGSAAESLIEGLPDAYVANFNSPRQTVVAHGNSAGDVIEARARQRGVRAQRLPVACAFHSPLVAAAGKPLSAALSAVAWRPLQTPVYGNGTAARYPLDAESIRTALADHLRLPVRFRDTVERLYHEEGIRLFLEVGPHSVLTGLVGQTLAGLAHTALSVDQKGRSGIHHLMQVLAQLVVLGTPVRGEGLFQIRAISGTSLEELVRRAEAHRTPTTWVVNSVRSRPWNAPEPQLIGQAMTSPASGVAALAGDERPARSATLPPVQSKGSVPTHRPAVVTPAVESQPMNPEPVHEDPQSMDDSSHVMLGFQQLMSQFLETQRAVMAAYLQGSPGTVGDGPNRLAWPPIAEPGREPITPTATVPSPPPVGELVPTEPRQPLPPVEPNGAPKDRDWLISELQDLISKRTGYPRESLTLDLNLEADLGIDSIKRVEILGEISEKIHTGNGAAESHGSVLPEGLEMEKLTSISTLRGIVDYLESALHPNGGGTPQALEHRSNGQSRRTVAALPSPDDPSDMESLRVQRAGVRLVDLAPLPDQTPEGATPSQAGAPELGGTVLIVHGASDDYSVVADRLRSRGCKIVFVACVAETSPRQTSADGWEADLTSPDGIQSLVESLRSKHSDLAGLLFLLPMSPMEDHETWDAVARREVRSLYLLARNLADDLRRFGTDGTAFLVAVTSLGGSLGYASSGSDEVRPGSGGVLGFVKSLAREWPEVLVRGLDMDLAETSQDRLAQRVLNELADPDGPYEVGYYQERRVTWEPVPRSDDPTSISTFQLASGAPILITGGARGITAAIALELARQFQPRLLIVGRAAIPSAEEPADIAGLTSAADLKGALLTRLEREGRPPTPALVESQFRDIQRQREMRANLDALRQTGVDLEYHQVDVRDATAFASYLDDVQRRFGPIVGVVHGAGVIEDRLVRDKTPESFDRVFDTKVVSSRVLSERLQPDHLQFMVLFVSLASRYGNRGQADYSAANEVVSKLALQLNRVWPGRIFAVAWGPWAEIGMVADLERHLTSRGLQLIRPDEGPRLFVNELRFGSADDAEIIIGGGARRLVQSTSPDRAGV